jgi:hypothetical protein
MFRVRAHHAYPGNRPASEMFDVHGCHPEQDAMTEARFDPSKAVTFDLASGLVHIEGAPSRLLVPADALRALCDAAGSEAVAAFGRALGVPMGRRVAARFASGSADAGGGVRKASVEAIVDHLGGELAIAGLGSLALERWGHALVLMVDHSPLEGAGDRVLEEVLAGALQAATGRQVRTLVLARSDARVRFLVAGDAAIGKAREWLAKGMTWGEALARLHGQASAARGDA